jgi:prepilin-type N-terminal cleavage/methylation domain-containing protein
MAKRPAQRGVTLVELLVTIVLASIFFAAMVPLFVYASQTSAGDNARTVALGIAQDKMERIRSLPYDQVERANLYADTTDGLGHHASATTGSGGKDYLVDYEVTYIYDPSVVYQEPGLELYKLVTVDVYWEGNPHPVKKVRLRSAIYRQYAGPVILGLQVTPRSQEGTTQGMLVPGDDHLVTITAYAMTGVPVKEVRFTVTSGTYSPKLLPVTDGTNGVYVCRWDAAGAPDGFYTITAQAISPGGYLGNEWQIVEQLETGSPPAPSSLTATPGDQSVTLDWQKPAVGDIAYYEIWRSTTSARDDATRLATSLKEVHYPDTSVTNDTHYYYWAYAIDLVGNTSEPATADATPSISAGDRTAPTVPVLTATTVQSTTITLSWLASQDPPPPDPSSGLAYYEIFRSTDGLSYTFLKKIDTQLGVPSFSCTDRVGTDSPPYWYEIRGVDASVNANRSVFSAPVGPWQTPATRTTLTVTNDRGGADKPCTVTVYDPEGRLYYDQSGATYVSPPASASIPSKGGSAQWHNLPLDKVYTVTATYSSGNPIAPYRSAPPWTLSFQ